MQRADSLEKILMLERLRAGGEEGDRGWLGIMTNLMKVSLSKLPEIVKDREAWYAAVHGVTKSQIWLSDWPTNNNVGLDYWCCFFHMPSASSLPFPPGGTPEETEKVHSWMKKKSCHQGHSATVSCLSSNMWGSCHPCFLKVIKFHASPMWLDSVICYLLCFLYVSPLSNYWQVFYFGSIFYRGEDFLNMI